MLKLKVNRKKSSNSSTIKQSSGDLNIRQALRNITNDDTNSLPMKSQRLLPMKNILESIKTENSIPIQQTHQSQFLLMSHFLKRIFCSLGEYLSQQRINWNMEKLNYQQLLLILYKLKYIQQFQEEDYMRQSSKNVSQQLKICYSIWLSLSHNKYLSLGSLVQFLAIVESVIIQNQVLQKCIEELQGQIQVFQPACLENKDPKFIFITKRFKLKSEAFGLVVDSQDRDKIQSHFSLLKCNRLKLENYKEEIISDFGSLSSPFISPRSRQLASNKRKKMSEFRRAEHSTINLDEIDLESQNKIGSQGNNIKQFHPLSPRQLSNSIKFLSIPKLDAIEYSSDELQMKKNKENYTFHPDIRSIKSPPRQKKPEIKNFDKVMKRMKKGRKIHEQMVNRAKKGWTFSQYQQKCKQDNLREPQNIQLESKNTKNVSNKEPNNLHIVTEAPQNKIESIEEQNMKSIEIINQKSANKREYIDIPILYVDVNLEEGRKERIIIYDADKASDLARSFGQKHELTQQTIVRLEMMLEQQIGTVLAKIEEAVEEDCSYLY